MALSIGNALGQTGPGLVPMTPRVAAHLGGLSDYNTEISLKIISHEKNPKNLQTLRTFSREAGLSSLDRCEGRRMLVTRG